MSRARSPRTAAALPPLLGGVAVVAGLLIAFGVGPGDAPEAPAPTASTPVPPSSPSQPRAPAPTPPDAVPEVGERILDASNAHALTARDGRLVWLTTEGATLGSAPYDGTEATVLYASEHEDRFGGALARDHRGVFFSVAGGGDQEPIHFVDASSLSRRDLAPHIVARGTSPDPLVATGDALLWADLGAVMRLEGDEAVELVRRTARIAAMIAHEGDLYWIEAPMEGAGRHAIATMAAEGGPVHIVEELDDASRDQLATDGQSLVWAEESGEGARLVRMPMTGGPIDEMASGAAVAALHLAERLYWAELRGGEPPSSAIRSAALPDGSVETHGRHDGIVTALTTTKKYLFWSSSRGLYRAPRNP